MEGNYFRNSYCARTSSQGREAFDHCRRTGSQDMANKARGASAQHVRFNETRAANLNGVKFLIGRSLSLRNGSSKLPNYDLVTSI